MIAKKYYVVWKGRKTGIFDNWEECEKQIHRFSGGEYKSFKAKEEAEKNFAKSNQVSLLSLRKEKMPAKDIYHDAVKNALIKDGWIITFDPYPIKYEEVKLVADLASEKTISASRDEQKIVVEIKSFLSRSPMREFETALGQYLIYQTFLSITYPEYKVYLAVGNKIYEKFFEQVAIKLILEKYKVLLLIVDINKEEIIKWIS